MNKLPGDAIDRDGYPVLLSKSPYQTMITAVNFQGSLVMDLVQRPDIGEIKQYAVVNKITE